jgi:hypothetical protein
MRHTFLFLALAACSDPKRVEEDLPPADCPWCSVPVVEMHYGFSGPEIDGKISVCMPNGETRTFGITSEGKRVEEEG